MNDNVLSRKSFDFSLVVIALYKQLVEEKEYVMSKQLLRCGTSVGANIFEANYASNTKDFVYKLTISRKEVNESIYWLRLLHISQFINNSQAEVLVGQCEEVIRILTSSIKTARKKL